ncbi:MAG: hypothetical protein R3C10_22575 [Pirellulales bacterium]
MRSTLYRKWERWLLRVEIEQLGNERINRHMFRATPYSPVARGSYPATVAGVFAT